MFNYVAVCQYPDKEAFRFYSPTFVVNHWSEIDDVAQRVVTEAWEEISPHEAPPIIDIVPGLLLYREKSYVP